MSTVVPFVDFASDVWVLPSGDYLPDYAFYFDYLSNDWFKKTLKQCFRDGIDLGRVKIQTLNRYNYCIRHFFDFLSSYELHFQSFADLDRKRLEMFLMYLLEVIDSSSTRGVIIAALKHVIRHGQLFEWEGFPIIDLFDGTEFRTVQSEDALKSMIIPDTIIVQFEHSFLNLKETYRDRDLEKLTRKNFQEIMTGCLIQICMYTGVRLSEALMLHEGSLTKDLIGKSLLEVVSEKNETERFIAVRKEVVNAIETLRKLTQKGREALETTRLFVYYKETKLEYGHLLQSVARLWLRKYLKKHEIKDSSGNIFEMTYHQFRHTLGTDLINNGMTPFEVQTYLGHESMHSTRLYAKIRNDRLATEYRRLGVIGMVVRDIQEAVSTSNANLDDQTLVTAALPDGICGKPINNEGMMCKRLNACLFCKKFITTPEHIEIHRDHLRRIRADREKYKQENYIGTDHHLQEVEAALLDIITRLERLGV